MSVGGGTGTGTAERKS